MSAKTRRTAFVTLLAMMGDPAPQPVSPTACRMCGRDEKYPTGECSFCGVYQCAECSKFHMGSPQQKCNGLGVDLPAPNATT